MAISARSESDPGRDEPPRQRRRMPTFLRLFLGILAALGAWAGAICIDAYRQDQAIREIQRLGGLASAAWPPFKRPYWLPQWIGDEWVHRFFDEIESVSFGGRTTVSLVIENGVLHAGTPPAISDADLRLLTRFKHLKRLELGDCGFTDGALPHLSHLYELESLDLQGNRISDAGLANLQALTRLSDLDLSGTGVTDQGLLHLRRLVHLKVLRLPQFEWTDAGLAALENLTELEDLSVSGSRITDVGLGHMRTVKNLKALYLKDSHVTDNGLRHLSAIHGLRRLDLSGTAVTDAGLAHLGELENLWYLDLSDTIVTDAGLAKLGNLRNLESLFVRGTAVTAAGVEAFNRRCPRAHVHGVDGVVGK